MQETTEQEKPNPSDKPSLLHVFLDYLITILVLSLITLSYIFGFQAFKQESNAEMYRILSNGFLLSGVVSIGIGLMVFVANEGGFHFLSFAFQKILSKFNPSMKVTYMSYGDFVLSLKGRRVRYGFLLLSGLLFFLFAVLFLILFHL